MVRFSLAKKEKKFGFLGSLGKGTGKGIGIGEKLTNAIYCGRGSVKGRGLVPAVDKHLISEQS